MDLGARWRELRRAASWHRRLLAAGLAAGAVAVGLQALAPPDPPTVAVIAAARDLAAGAQLAAGDVRVIRLAPDAVPSGAITSISTVDGRSVSSPVRAGEALTDVRLVGPSLVDALGPELVAAPVRFADTGAVALVRPGDRIDVLATPAAMGEGTFATRTIASEVVVLAVPGPGISAGFVDGALLVLATTPDQAADLASASVSAQLSLVLRGLSES